MGEHDKDDNVADLMTLLGCGSGGILKKSIGSFTVCELVSAAVSQEWDRLGDAADKAADNHSCIKMTDKYELYEDFSATSPNNKYCNSLD